MTKVNGLSIAFVESHPGDAARVLETFAAQDTAEFLAALEPRLGAPILRHLGPAYAARVATRLEDEKVVSMIQVMGPQAAAAIVQQLPNEHQLRLLARLPVGTSVAIRLLVGYPRGTCGAAMDPWPLTLAPDMTAAEALEQVKQFDGELGDCLFVSNGQRRLVGMLNLGDLLRSRPREPLSAVMKPASHKVSALASAATVVNHPGWDECRALPVVERENRLVGALHRRALTAAVAAPGVRAQSSVASGVFAAYWQMVSALTEVAVGALPPVPPVGEERRNDER